MPDTPCLSLPESWSHDNVIAAREAGEVSSASFLGVWRGTQKEEGLQIRTLQAHLEHNYSYTPDGRIVFICQGRSMQHREGCTGSGEGGRGGTPALPVKSVKSMW